MSQDTSSDLDANLLDDFFSEADEHLLRIRRDLVSLEDSVGAAQTDPQIIEGLFREFHSFKGISGIVRLNAAEAIAHATEDYLRLMKSGQFQLTKAGLEALMSSAQKLEQIVAAFRAQKPMPGYESLLAELKQQCTNAGTANAKASSSPTPGTETEMRHRVDEAKSRGLMMWKYFFSPTHDLNAGGVTVNTIREELSKLGEVLKCSPIVQGAGKISFEFLVAAKEAPADLTAWEAKGVSVAPIETEEPESKADAAPEASSEEAHNPFLAPSHVVRIDLKRLDELMRITAEMVIHRSRLETQLARVGIKADVRGVQEVSNSLGRSLRELREAVMRVRLVPVAEIFARMPFVVRDLTRQTEKKARLKLVGQDTAVDKYVLERLKDPLLHLVRNAFSHGVESPAARVATGKPEEAIIELKAASSGDAVVIEVSDDGRGINPNAVAQRAKKLGLEVPEKLDDAAVLNILCSSGFSTREDADTTSGRGVGMAIVLSTVRELGGNLSLSSEEGRGTRFTLRLPLTLAIMEALIVTAAKQTCAVPQGAVREILHVMEDDIRRTSGIEMVSYRSGVLPVTRLAGMFRRETPDVKKMCMLVIASERGSVGLLVENVLGQREIVVRTMADPLIQVNGIMGATELGDGKPVLIIDGAALTSGNVRPPEQISAN